jgi:hypothetical protein
MKIINLTRENAQLQFSINELIIFKNLLTETCKRLPIADFQETIRGISRDESLELASTIDKIIDLSHQNYDFRLESHSIQVIQLIKNQVTLQLQYKIVLGLRSILNELCHGMYVEDFQSPIEFDKTSVFNLLDSIHSNVVEKMGEDLPGNVIHKKTIEISNFLIWKRNRYVHE